MMFYHLYLYIGVIVTGNGELTLTFTVTFFKVNLLSKMDSMSIVISIRGVLVSSLLEFLRISDPELKTWLTSIYSYVKS